MHVATQVETRFGTIDGTGKVSVKSGRSKESFGEIPVDQIRSVKQDVVRHTGMGIGFLLLASVFYPVLFHPIGVAGALLFSLAGALLIWGSPAVIITTLSGQSRRVKGTPWSFGEADRFVSALRDSVYAARMHR